MAKTIMIGTEDKNIAMASSFSVAEKINKLNDNINTLGKKDNKFEELYAKSLNVESNIIEINSEKIGQAGIKINREDASPYIIEFDGTDNNFKVGTQDDLKPIATQEYVDNAIATTTPKDHTHDDRHYTETEIDTKLNGKANSSHTHNYLPLTGGFLNGPIHHKETNLTKGTNPSGTGYYHQSWINFDSSGKDLGRLSEIRSHVSNTGTSFIELVAYDYKNESNTNNMYKNISSLKVIKELEGEAYTTINNNLKVGNNLSIGNTKVTMQYNSTTESLDFIFA